MAVNGSDSSGATAGELAGASQFGQSAVGLGGAFSLGAQAYNGPTVYYGLAGQKKPARGQAAAPAEDRERQPLWLTPQQAYQDYFTWDAKQRRDLWAAGVQSGQLKESDGDLEASAWWKSLVEQSARYGAAGVYISPMDLAGGYVGNAGLGLSDQERFKMTRGLFPSGAIFDSNGKYTRTYRDGQFIVNEITGERTYAGPKFRTTTQARTDMSDPETAKALTTSIFQQLVGRDPGPGELGQFAAALAQAEQQNPTSETTTSQFDEQGNVVASSTTSSGGLTQAAREQLLKDKLRESPEAGSVQAATTYMTALKRKIWGGPGA